MPELVLKDPEFKICPFTELFYNLLLLGEQNTKGAADCWTLNKQGREEQLGGKKSIPTSSFVHYLD